MSRGSRNCLINLTGPITAAFIYFPATYLTLEVPGDEKRTSAYFSFKVQDAELFGSISNGNITIHKSTAQTQHLVYGSNGPIKGQSNK